MEANNKKIRGISPSAASNVWKLQYAELEGTYYGMCTQLILKQSQVYACTVEPGP